MSGSMKQVALGVALALGMAWSAQAQQAPAPASAPAPAAGPPAGFVAPAEPGVDENNAQRAKSQPGNNAPMWRAVRESGTQPGTSNLPGAEMGVLIQPFTQYPGSAYTTAGEAWRQVRNNWIIPYGGALLLIALLATCCLVYWVKGPFGKPVKDTGRKIERFTPYRTCATHWAAAISFAVLGISGIVMAFGKFFLLPVLGGTLFGWLTYALKTAHNLSDRCLPWLWCSSIKYLADNLPRAGDMNWLLKGGGLFGGHHMPSHRFNAGEKVMYWVGGIVLGLSSWCRAWCSTAGAGLRRDTRRDAGRPPRACAGVGTDDGLFLGHIYMATFGVPGAMEAMKTGYVDESWAKEHHELWYDDVKAGKIPAVRSQTPPPRPGAASSKA
jgi:formate dehydrogenase subunit gamma